MARVVRVGWVTAIPQSKDLGYTWANNYCCIVRLDELKRGDLAVLVEPGEAVPTWAPEFEFLEAEDDKPWRHIVHPVTFFGYASEALLVPAREGMLEGSDPSDQLFIDGHVGAHADMTKLGAAVAIAYGVCVALLVGLTLNGILDQTIALATLFGSLVVYAIAAVTLKAFGRAV